MLEEGEREGRVIAGRKEELGRGEVGMVGSLPPPGSPAPRSRGRTNPRTSARD